MTQTASKPSLGQRLMHEIRQYAAISLYLYVWFGAVLLYKAAVLGGQGIGYAPYGLAAIKAVILGKFMLMAQMIPLGARMNAMPPLQQALIRSLLTLVVLAALTVVEEAVKGAIHGETLAHSMAQLGGGTGLQIAAILLLMLLILIPYFLFRQVSQAMGPGMLRRLLLGSR